MPSLKPHLVGMGVFSDFISNIVNKNLGIPKVFLEKNLESWSHNWNDALVAVLIMSLSEADGTAKESGGKHGIIYFRDTWYFKKIFTLLTKVVAVHESFFGVGFWGPGFK